MVYSGYITRKKHLRWLLAGMLLMLASCNRSPEWKILPLPALPEQTIHLRAVYVFNPRFPGVDKAQQQAILDKTQQLVKQHFGLDVAFDPPIDAIPIERFFRNLSDAVKREGVKQMLPLDNITPQQRSRLRDSIYQTLLNYEDDREQVIAYANPYLLKPVADTDFHKLADALTDTLLARLQSWREQKARDGRPVLDGSPYNEWVWWDTLGYGDIPYDVALTNQLVASAEFYGMDVHSSLRGGITAGTTAYSRNAQFRAYSWVSLYPLLNDLPLLQTLRGDAHYSQQQIADYAAAILTHELGHLLLHLGHPFGNAYCIMAPMPLLKFREWYDGLDARQCPIGGEPQMTPGAAQIEYRANW